MLKSFCPSSRLFVVAAIIVSFVAAGQSQKVQYKPQGKTTASPEDYSVSYGSGIPRLPRNYNYYYYGHDYSPSPAQGVQHVLLSVVPTESLPAPAIGYVKPYSDAEYSNLVIQEMNKARERNGVPLIGASSPPEPPAQPPTEVAPEKEAPALQVNKQPTDDTAMASRTNTDSGGEERAALRVATIAKVLDRGVLVTSEGARIRMRGVAFPSLHSKHPRRREFAARALKGLEELTVGKDVYFVIEKPEKGLDGCWLAIVHLPDGTELNRLALESGMAIISPNEFSDESEADNLLAAMDSARNNKRGFWADTNMAGEVNKAPTR